MSKASRGRRFHAGPRTLVVVTAAAIALGAWGMYSYGGNRANLLYFFYVPVAAVSVVLGRKMGVLLAVLAAIVAVAPSAAWGLSYLVPDPAVSSEKIATLAVWVVFLLAMAWLVGWVSERGGSLSLTQGLGARAIRAMERERRRTGQDIHDGIAQYAAAAYMETEILGSLTADTTPEIQAQVERLRRPIGFLVEEARSMVGILRPPALGPAEFNSSLCQLVDSFESRSGVSCVTELEGNFAAHSDSMRICIYRTTQEALANIERHSEATAARVWARAGKGGVDLIVRDNGKGFRPEDHGNGKGNGDGSGNGNGHFGLRGMRERAGYLGGRLVIRSTPGEGTSVAVHVPSYRGDENVRVRPSRVR